MFRIKHIKFISPMLSFLWLVFKVDLNKNEQMQEDLLSLQTHPSFTCLCGLFCRHNRMHIQWISVDTEHPALFHIRRLHAILYLV